LRVEVRLHVFVTSALVEVRGQLHVPVALLPGIRGWVVPRASMDAVAKCKNPCPCQESNPCYQAHTDWAIPTLYSGRL